MPVGSTRRVAATAAAAASSGSDRPEACGRAACLRIDSPLLYKHFDKSGRTREVYTLHQGRHSLYHAAASARCTEVDSQITGGPSGDESSMGNCDHSSLPPCRRCRRSAHRRLAHPRC